MTKKSKSLLIGSLLVGGLLVAGIGVTAAYVAQKNNEYATTVNKLAPGTSAAIAELEPEALPNEKVESRLVVTPSGFTMKLKDLKSDGYATVQLTINNQSFEAPVVEGKATLEVAGLRSNQEYSYSVNGKKEDKTSKAIFGAKLRTPVGAFFDESASIIAQNTAELHIAGMQFHAGNFRPMFSVSYKIKDATDVHTLEEENIDKQMMLSESVYTINLKNLSLDSTYVFTFGSEGKEVLTGEFKTLPLKTIEN